MEYFSLSPLSLLQAYTVGVFPMARTRKSKKVYWVDPPIRGIIPLAEFHIPRRLRQDLRRAEFSYSFNRSFATVVANCVRRDGSWINAEIEAAYNKLHKIGHAHSVEVWHKKKLIGGLYGVSIGAAFFGESMFSKKDHASKAALIRLVLRLNRAGFRLLDTQFVTDHLRQFGAKEIFKERYHSYLQDALKLTLNLFDNLDENEMHHLIHNYEGREIHGFWT